MTDKPNDWIEEIIENSKLYQGFQCDDYIIRIGLKKQLFQAIKQEIKRRVEALPTYEIAGELQVDGGAILKSDVLKVLGVE